MNILDSQGQPINTLSIVHPYEEDSMWTSYQGLVVAPHSDLEGSEYTVAVFFNKEVGSHEFFHRSSPGISINAWDQKYRDQCKASETEFLLKDDMWKHCPRVVFFRPDELIVQADWDISALAKRVFGSMYHTVYTLKKGYPTNPTSYMCFMETCRKPATKQALGNVWGSVSPIYTCDECFPKINGLCADSLPELKHPFLTPEGIPIEIPKEVAVS